MHLALGPIQRPLAGGQDRVRGAAARLDRRGARDADSALFGSCAGDGASGVHDELSLFSALG